MVMLNYMKCTSLMFGSRVRFGIGFTERERNVTIYQRKMFHNFKVYLDQNKFNDAVAIDLPLQKKYMIGNQALIQIRAHGTHEVVETIKVKANPG